MSPREAQMVQILNEVDKDYSVTKQIKQKLLKFQPQIPQNIVKIRT